MWAVERLAMQAAWKCRLWGNPCPTLTKSSCVGDRNSNAAEVIAAPLLSDNALIVIYLCPYISLLIILIMDLTVLSRYNS